VTYRRYRATRAGRRAVAALALVVLVLVGIEAGARAQQTARGSEVPVVATGVTVSGLEVSGLTKRELREALAAYAARPLVLSFGEHTWRYAPQTLGTVTDIDSAVRKALRAGPGERVRLPVHVNERRLNRWLRRFAADFDRSRENARIVLRGLRPHVVPAQVGRSLVRWSTKTAVLSELRANDRGPLRLDASVREPRVTRSEVGTAIVIRRATNRLYFYKGSGPKGMRVARKFRVATGTSVYPTPLGSFEIVDLQRNPWWYPPDSDWAAGASPVPPGPGNPLGTRWMGLSEPLIGIHGTPDAASIGYSASHGCIRMLVPEAEWLFERVERGTPVYILDA
jgi:hypothetical protein